jgi:hypothetical protein
LAERCMRWTAAAARNSPAIEWVPKERTSARETETGGPSLGDEMDVCTDEMCVSMHRGSQEDGEVNRMCGSVSHSPSVQGRMGR